MAQREAVLLLAATPAGLDRVGEAAARLRPSGARTLLASYCRFGRESQVPGVDEARDLLWHAELHGPAFRRALREADASERMWLHLQADSWVAEQLPAVQVVIWLDPRSKDAAQRLVTECPGLRSFGRLDRAVAHLARHAVPMGRSRDVLPAPAGRRRLLRERIELNVPGLPAERRYEIGRGRALRHLQEGDASAAEEAVRSALTRIDSCRLRADLLGDVVSVALARGEQPSLALEAYAAALQAADEAYAAGDYHTAAGWFAEATRTAFHRVLHFDALSSPMAEDPEAFTAPLRASTVATALREPGAQDLRRQKPRVRGLEVPVSEPDRPTRLLIATRKNADFLHEIRSHFDAHHGYETRFADFLGDSSLESYASEPALLVEQVLARDHRLTAAVERAFRPHLDWADVVLVEWCTALAALVSRTAPGGARIVVRMHAYEAFTQWPQLTDFSRIDDLVFVSEHLRSLAVASTPSLAGGKRPRLHVVSNAMNLRRFVRPKSEEARFTLGVVGASKVVKDPRWAIDVLRRLRRHDDRYRLVLIRGELQDRGPGTAAYAAALQRDLDELAPSGAIEVLRHTDDVPAALEQVGVVVSSSVRESFHMGLVEGVASGALPVVRDWPFFEGAARTLFPREWVVDSPAAATERVLAFTRDPAIWRAETAMASQLVLDRWDWSVVSRDFERLFGTEA